MGADINKPKGDAADETRQGVVSDKLPELTLKMTDEEIIKLTQKWESAWNDSPEKAKWTKQIEENEKYWLGEQFDKIKADNTRPDVDNVIFEAVETHLPQVTRRNPEPLVELDSSEIPDGGESDPVKLQYVEKVKRRLKDLADKNALRLKLKKAARHWEISQLGIAKFGWDLDRDIPAIRIVRPKKVILDPTATIDEDGYTGGRIGEIRKLEASKIISIIGDSPDSEKTKKVVTDHVKDDTATEVQFIEWWTNEYMCWTLGKDVLLKRKNPHWNYDRTETPEVTDIAAEGVTVDDFGVATAAEIEILGINHLPTPQMPYKFLSVFNLGDQPMDKTGLIQQNLSNQDRVNKRNKQIDKNVDRMNNGAVVSLARSGLTKPQAQGVVEAIRKGGAVVIPDGAPQDAVYFPQVSGMPNDVYNDLQDTRSRLRDIFGTTGSTPAGIQNEDTVRGKIMTRGLDTDRTGGGVSEYLEQFADQIYNWMVQLLYVYDPAFQFVGDARPPKITVSVKEGSLLPKDSISIANQALELASLNRIANVDLYKRLEYPNPEELAANVWLETNAPHLLYKDNPLVQEAIAAAAAAAQASAESQALAKGEDHARGMEMQGAKKGIVDNTSGQAPLSEVPQEGL